MWCFPGESGSSGTLVRSSPSISTSVLDSPCKYSCHRTTIAVTVTQQWERNYASNCKDMAVYFGWRTNNSVQKHTYFNQLSFKFMPNLFLLHFLFCWRNRNVDCYIVVRRRIDVTCRLMVCYRLSSDTNMTSLRRPSASWGCCVVSWGHLNMINSTVLLCPLMPN